MGRQRRQSSAMKVHLINITIYSRVGNSLVKSKQKEKNAKSNQKEKYNGADDLPLTPTNKSDRRAMPERCHDFALPCGTNSVSSRHCVAASLACRGSAFLFLILRCTQETTLRLRTYSTISLPTARVAASLACPGSAFLFLILRYTQETTLRLRTYSTISLATARTRNPRLPSYTASRTENPCVEKSCVEDIA